MASGRMNTRRLSHSKVCEIVGVSRQQRRALVHRGLLAPGSEEGSGLQDALHLAALVVLSNHLSPTDTAVAWKQLSAELEAAVPGERFDAVFDNSLGLLMIARDSEELRRLVVHGRAVHVLPLAERLQEVGDAFRRWAEATPEPTKRRRSYGARKNA